MILIREEWFLRTNFLSWYYYWNNSDKWIVDQFCFAFFEWRHHWLQIFNRLLTSSLHFWRWEWQKDDLYKHSGKTFPMCGPRCLTLGMNLELHGCEVEFLNMLAFMISQFYLHISSLFFAVCFLFSFEIIIVSHIKGLYI